MYFVARIGCPKLVTTPTSNSGWHSKRLWFEGGELSRIRPWHRLSLNAVKSLGDVVSPDFVDLSAFCGVSSRYSAG